jgi:hypothetical protein
MTVIDNHSASLFEATLAIRTLTVARGNVRFIASERDAVFL